MNNITGTQIASFFSTATSSNSSTSNAASSGFGALLDSLQGQVQAGTANVTTGGFTNVNWFTVDGQVADTATQGSTNQSGSENFAAVGIQMDTPDGNFSFEGAAVNGSADFSGTLPDGDGAFTAHLDANGQSSVQMIVRADMCGSSLPTTNNTIAMLFAEISQNATDSLTAAAKLTANT